MNKPYAAATSVALALLLTCSVALADQANTSFSAGGRYHVQHSVFTDLPFEDGDISYGAAYEYHEQNAYWQLALTYADSVGPDDAEASVLTPEMNLIFKDESWRLGTGLLISQIDSDVDGSDWSDLYWQFIGGFGFPIKRVSIELLAYYVFEQWDKLSDFDTDDIEFGVWITLPF